MDGRERTRKQKLQLEALRKHSVGPPDSTDVIIAVTAKGSKKKKCNVWDGPGNAASVWSTRPLAFDLAFSMTIHKAQGRTIPRVVLALSEHPAGINRMQHAAIFVALSRVKSREHIKFLNHGVGPLRTRERAFEHLTRLLPNASIQQFCHGFEHTDGAQWNPQKALEVKF